jgi:hypothetical protein
MVKTIRSRVGAGHVLSIDIFLTSTTIVCLWVFFFFLFFS